MTTFKEIRGTAVQSLSSDPTNPEAGQIWYNNSIGVLKGYALTAAAWASGGSMGTARYGLAGAGTQTEALGFGGYNSGAGGYLVATEEYNGSAWAGGGNMSTSRYALAGCGTQTVGLAFGGSATGVYKSSTEEYNGSTWTNGGNLGTAKSVLAGAGTQTAGLGFGGYSGTFSTATEEFTGTQILTRTVTVS